jgi:hypothetical protein
MIEWLIFSVVPKIHTQTPEWIAATHAKVGRGVNCRILNLDGIRIRGLC